MGFFATLKAFIKKYIFGAKWCCNNCGKEIFNDKYFCDDCLKLLPYNDGYICQHCGRQVLMPLSYCSTCKDSLIDIDICRSVFVYKPPISNLVQGAKYSGKRYILEMFAHFLEHVYIKNFFSADFLCYVPMTESAFKKRGYNQSQLLAKELSKLINVQVLDCLVKTRDTTHQAKLNKAERLKNLQGVFKVVDKSKIKDKTLLLIDDVTTTGSTAQGIANTLKRAGAKSVLVLTVASVPSRDGY